MYKSTRLFGGCSTSESLDRTRRIQNKRQMKSLRVLFLSFSFSFITDREGSKSQLRHTEPPREHRKRKETKTWRQNWNPEWGERKKEKKKKKRNTNSPEKFVQQLLDVTFQQEQQQSAVRFIYFAVSLFCFFSQYFTQLSNNTGTGVTSSLWSIRKHHRFTGASSL